MHGSTVTARAAPFEQQIKDCGKRARFVHALWTATTRRGAILLFSRPRPLGLVIVGRFLRYPLRTPHDHGCARRLPRRSRLVGVESLFDEAEERAAEKAAPLAVRMRPKTLDDVVGQEHLTAAGTPFRKLIDNDAPMSLMLWGPPGTGK